MVHQAERYLCCGTAFGSAGYDRNIPRYSDGRNFENGDSNDTCFFDLDERPDGYFTYPFEYGDQEVVGYYATPYMPSVSEYGTSDDNTVLGANHSTTSSGCR